MEDDYRTCQHTAFREQHGSEHSASSTAEAGDVEGSTDADMERPVVIMSSFLPSFPPSVAEHHYIP